jgi:molybdenum-dependent DNA-binding transcriptional regulator ModE
VKTDVIYGDDLPDSPLVERERQQAESVCAELERIANMLLELHLALHAVQERIRRDA